jgi:hypothetical protein
MILSQIIKDTAHMLKNRSLSLCCNNFTTRSLDKGWWVDVAWHSLKQGCIGFSELIPTKLITKFSVIVMSHVTD